jgi:thiamine biosynthesis lipoprotein
MDESAMRAEPRTATGAVEGNAARLRRAAHRAMGTEFTAYIDALDDAQARACFQSIVEEIDRVERTFSRFRPASEISRINRLAGGGPMVTDPEVFNLLVAAREVSRKTGGVFDITLGRLTRAWGFAERAPKVPEAQALEEAEKASGWQYLELDPAWRTVQFLRPGMELDLGAIAKGYAVDCVLGVLRAAGVSGVIDAGSSSIAATDGDFAKDWMVSIANPADETRPLGEVRLGGRALSTSGVKEQSFRQDGRIYSHLIDPKVHGFDSGAAARQVLQATVLAPRSTLADALSTAMFLLGQEKGSAALAEFPDCSALWICTEGVDVKCQAHRWP